MRSTSHFAVALGAIGGALIASTPAPAFEYPWCAQYSQHGLPSARYAMVSSSIGDGSRHAADVPRLAQGGGSGGRNCGFMTLEQCRAAISGTGGFCEPNPFYKGPEPVPPRRPRR